MGAIQPPWIEKDEFFRLPFNYCDRWCERCRLKTICKVYLEGQEDRERAIREGKDPDSMEFAFEVVRKNLEQTFKLIYEGAKRWNVPLEELNKEPTDEELEEMRAHEKDPIYKMARRLSDRIYNFLQKFDKVPIGTDIAKIKQDVDIIDFYHTLIFAKTARALSSERREERQEDEELKTYDDKTSAFIVAYSLQQIGNSFLDLAEERSLDLTRKVSLKLAKASLSLAQTLATRFAFKLEFDDKYCL